MLIGKVDGANGVADPRGYVTCESYFCKTGIYGVPKVLWRWEGYTIACKIFKLGVLRFQIAPSRYDAEIDGVSIKKGEPCISVHISRDGGLDEEKCAAAYPRFLFFLIKLFLL